MAAPYIPAKDADFDAWIQNFNTLLTANPTNYGLVAADATAVDAVTDPWVTAYPIAINPATRTSGTIATKDAARATAEATIRPYAIRIRNNPAVSDALKLGIGVTVPNVPPTPIPAPTVAPELGLLAAISLQQTLTFKAVGAAGKAKPFGAVGVQIFRNVGTTEATDPEQCTYVGQYTKSPFRQTFLAGDQGKKATYFARFVTRSGPEGVAQVGPWSDRLVLIVM
jgi:hypothetical protein